MLNVDRVVSKIDLNVLTSGNWKQNLIPEALEYFVILGRSKA